MLSKELKELEMNELALKEDHDNFPVLIEYGLTPYGQTLSPLLENYTPGAPHTGKEYLSRNQNWPDNHQNTTSKSIF